MRRVLLGAVGLLLLCSLATPAPAHTPDRVMLGDTALVLNGEGARRFLFIRAYSVALFLPQPMADAARIMAPHRPKALRIEAHRNSPGWVAREWRALLDPVLHPDQGHLLLDAYGNLRAGDIAWVTYHPSTGTDFFVNDRLVLRSRGPELMNVFLHRWIGPGEVSSEELRSALLAARTGGVFGSPAR